MTCKPRKEDATHPSVALRWRSPLLVLGILGALSRQGPASAADRPEPAAPAEREPGVADALPGSIERASRAECPAAFPDPAGNLRELCLGGERFPVATEVRVPVPGWRRVASSRRGAVRSVEHFRAGQEQTWTARLEIEPEETFLCVQRWSAGPEGGVWDVLVASETERPTAGVYGFVRLPTNLFAGGEVQILADGRQAVRVVLAENPSASPPVESLPAQHITMSPAGGRWTAHLKLSRRCSVTVQDERMWGDAAWGLLFPLTTNALRAGESTSLRVAWRVEGAPDRTPVLIRLRPERPSASWDGAGGNYVFDLASPVTEFCRQTLTSAWARTAMSLEAWEPVNDNESPQDSHWGFLESQDRPGSALREELQMAARIERTGLRHVVSVWYLPAWMIEGGRTNREAFGQTIAPDCWPEVLESLSSYLVYARLKYGVEPDLFSFNEPDLGVHVGFSPSDYARMVRDLGQRFRALGLKTRVLLGDLASPRMIGYLDASLSDADAMRGVGAVGVHAWGRTDGRTLAAWRELAQRLKVPLLVSEMGADAEAWRTPWVFESPLYALDEMLVWQEALAFARPVTILAWQFTGNYPLAAGDPGRVQAGPRHAFLRHLCNVTPTASRQIEVETTHAAVLATAFAKESPGRGPGWWTVHIANEGAAREATVMGFPETVGTVYPLVSSIQEVGQRPPPLAVKRGTCSLELPALSLVTLTTVAPPSAPP